MKKQPLGTLLEGVKAEKSVTVVGEKATVICCTRLNENSPRVLNKRVFDFSSLTRGEIIELAVPEAVIRQQAIDRASGTIAHSLNVTLPFPVKERKGGPKLGTIEHTERSLHALPKELREGLLKQLAEEVQAK